MAVDMKPRGDHDAALRELLLKQVRTSHDTATGRRARQREQTGRDRWRPVVATGIVTVAVVLIGLAAINLHLSDRATPAHSTTPVLPVPSGRIVKTLSDSTGGTTQTFPLNTAGSAFTIVLACTGGSNGSDLRVNIPHHADTAIGCGQGLDTGSDTVGANTGTIPVTMTATDRNTHWRVDFVTTEPTARGYTYPSEQASEVVDPLSVITDPAQGDAFVSRSPDVLLHATGTDGRDHTATLDLPPGVTTVRIWINCTDGAHFAISLPRYAHSGSCASSDMPPSDARFTAGSHVTIDYAVPEPDGSAYALLVVALPPTQ